MSGMIHKTLIGMKAKGEDHSVSPPARALDLEVIGEDAYLDVVELDRDGNVQGKPTARVQVHARSLLRALATAIEDHDS